MTNYYMPGELMVELSHIRFALTRGDDHYGMMLNYNFLLRDTNIRPSAYLQIYKDDTVLA